MTMTCLESRSESLELRTCHECGYLLIGLQEPARCPECGATELPQDVLTNGYRACCWWRVAFLGPFINRNAGESLWKIVLHPALARTARNRALLIIAAFVCAVLTAAVLCNWWVYKIPDNPDSGTYTQRCWWYEVLRQGMSQAVVYAQTPAGETIAYHYDLGASGKRIPLAILWLATSQVFDIIFDLFLIPWVFLLVGWALLCAVALGVESRRGFRMAGVLTASFVPFLLFVPVMFVAKLAYVFFWIDWRVIQYLFFLHLILSLWPGFVYVRYAMLAGSSRWRRYVCAGVIFLVVILWPIAKRGAFLLTKDHALGWI